MARSDGKHQMAEVRAFLLDWDAIGVADVSQDEYDCMAGPLLRQLHEGADADALHTWITQEREDHFGLDPDVKSDRALADRLAAWWSDRSGTAHQDSGTLPPAS